MIGNCWSTGQMCHSEEVNQRSNSSGSSVSAYSPSHPQGLSPACLLFICPVDMPLCVYSLASNQPFLPNALTDKSGISLNTV